MKKRDIFGWMTRHSLPAISLLALLLTIVLETLARRSLVSCVLYIVGSPGQFLFNVLIVLATLSISLLFKRRVFFATVISAVWITLGITNCALLGFRTTPFSAADFRLLTTAFDIFDLYLAWWQMVLIVIAVVLLGIALFFLWKKGPQYTGVSHILRGVGVLGAVALCIYGANGYIASAEETSFKNLADAYENYGFAYCFSVSVVNTGMSEPEGYSEETIDGIVEALAEDKAADAGPNIIYLQLESFFDVTNVEGIEFSEDPIPVFRSLMESSPSGLLYVPGVGAGTANTEFEVLTGMCIDYFGTGEYPYKTVLQDHTCESIAYNLAGLGYTSHALHNHRGAFYDRNKVYAMLGFDTFTSLEYMQDVEKTERNWAKDAILVDEIFGAMDSTAGKDFVFAVSVQAHGTYPTTVRDTPLTISAAGLENEDQKTQVEYYVQQLKEVDEFLGRFIAALEAYDEDVILMIYGDHLPSIESFEEFTVGDEYTTPYVIWNNFGLVGEGGDLEAFQINAAVQEMLGMNYGVMTKYHQLYSGTDQETYMDGIMQLQYDMLYGKGHIYGEVGAYESTAMTMGYNEIQISGAKVTGESLYVYGEGFTNSSYIYIDGEYMSTVYLSNGLLRADISEMSGIEKASVVQRDKNRLVLSSTEEVFISGIE